MSDFMNHFFRVFIFQAFRQPFEILSRSFYHPVLRAGLDYELSVACENTFLDVMDSRGLLGVLLV